MDSRARDEHRREARAVVAEAAAVTMPNTPLVIRAFLGSLILAAACAPDAAIAPDDTIAKAILRFGQYHVDEYVPPAPVALPTMTPDGAFTVTGTSKSLHRVGKVGARWAYWAVEQSSPVYLFPPDTVTTLTALAVNDRGEVVLGTGGSAGKFYIWRSGVMQLVPTTCGAFSALNNRGVMAFRNCMQLYDNFSVQVSPFSPDTTGLNRAWRQNCALNVGRYTSLIALSDSNAILAGMEIMPGAEVVLINPGCKSLDSLFRGGWNVLGEARLVGGQVTRGGFGVATLTDGEGYAAVNDLLDAASKAEWSVLSITRIDADRSIIAVGVRVSSNTTATVKLSPSKP
jgi:hypothetical protein